MKKQTLKRSIVMKGLMAFSFFIFQFSSSHLSAQSVLLDAHSNGSGTSSWDITTLQPNELLLISVGGYGTLSNAAGTVTVNGTNATYINEAVDGSSFTFSGEIWAFPAPAAGTYTIACTEAGISGPFIFNYAVSLYQPSSVLNVSNVVANAIGTTTGVDTVSTVITTTAPGSYVYGYEVINDNGGSGTTAWNLLTQLDNNYISDGIDGGHAGFTMATAGTYTITVTDAGVNNPYSALVVAAVKPNNPQCNGFRDSISLHTDVGCFGGNGGRLSIGTRGGVAPYTYAWSNGSTKYTISNLTAGSYTVTVTDHHGCSLVTIATIKQPATALVASVVSVSDPLCHSGKGSASVTQTGGTSSYKYLWSPNVSSNSTSTNLSAGTYTVTVQDANGCKSPVVISITQPVAIRDSMVAAAKVNVDCRGNSSGSATVGVKYGTSPYTYAWSNGQTNSTATGLSAGVYSVTVSDNNGCSGTTATVTITQPATALSGFIGSVSCSNSLVKASVNGIGGTVPYTYLWSPGGKTSSLVTGMSQGTYTVTVTDAHGCSATVSKNLVCASIVLDDEENVTPACCTTIDNITVYPNPNNGQFTVQSSVAGGQVAVEIYNVMGQKVYSQSSIHNSRFTVNISDQPNGIYLIRILDNNGNLVSQKKVVKTN